MIGEDQWEITLLFSVEQSTLLNEVITEIHRLKCRYLAKLQIFAITYYDRMIRILATL